MASTASVVPTATSNTGNTQNSPAGQKDGTTKSSLKQGAGAKAAEKGRKESPVDTARRSGAPKAWTSGTNPLTQQRASTPTQQNGTGSQGGKASGNAKMITSKDSVLSDRQSHDRLRFLFGGAVGLSVVLTTKSGDKYEGVFAGSAEISNSTKITLKMTKKVQNMAVTQPNGVGSREAAFVGSSPEHAMTFDLKDMADMTIPEFSLPEISKQVNGAGSTFQTDSDISGNANRGERILQRWVPDGPENTDLSLEGSNTSGWDQFATHDKMFGIQSTYTEETYTTAIDRSAPDYKKKEAEAARIAREIESSTSGNTHVREERGQAVENDFDDEEDKYSGVRREERVFPPLTVGGSNKYTPPARRAPTALPTVPGAPFDSAIISVQMSRGAKEMSSASSRTIRTIDHVTPEVGKPSEQRESSPAVASDASQSDKPAENLGISNGVTSQSKDTGSISPQRNAEVDNPSNGVENKVLDHFRQFANAERARLAEKKRVQASQDRSAKINDLVRFSRTFKLKTPIPGDLVGILAKDPKKQEAIIERAQKDHDDSKFTPPGTAAGTSTSTAQNAPIPKFDKSQIPPPIPDRNTLNAGRGNFSKQTVQRGGRLPQQQPSFPGPSVPSAPRASTQSQRDKTSQLPGVPAPIPLPEPRIPTGPMADQSALSSPRGSNTPASAVSTKFNVRALEFRPTAAPFNPTASSNAPTSPGSAARTGSVSRTASPSSFFGRRKPKAASERLNPTQNFNPIKRMKQEITASKSEKASKNEKSDQPVRDYTGNGGIPNAYQTGPLWVVREENKDKTYDEYFKPTPITSSPTQSRSGSTHAMSFHGQMGPMSGGPHMSQHMTSPQHGPHGPHYPHQFDEQRMHMQTATPQVYPSPSMGSRQISAYASPMGHPAQLAYGQQPYFAGPGGPMQMRPYVNTPGMMHAQPGQMAAPMMMQQQSSGPYMGVPPQYNQMPMYSPTPAQVYPQQNGYPSPGRMAPMMMQQNSQQGHHAGQPMMYHNPGPGGPMGYGQQQGMMRGGYGGHQTPYGSSPHQPHHMAQRAMSSGYGQKSIPQIPTNPSAPANAPQQPAAFAQMGNDEAK